MASFTIARPRGFQLAAATEFYGGFTPGSGMAAAAIDRLTLAFHLDGSFVPVVAALRERGAELVIDLAGSDNVDTARRQLARILGLEADADAWLELGRRDPLVGALQAGFPGFFTAAKASPYDASTWAVIAPRMNMRQAAQIKMALAREHGTAIAQGGRTHHVFPAPAALAEIDEVAGLGEEKVNRLRGVARAALAGKLDAAYLRALPEAEALTELQTLRGVGPWAASHIYFRGAAPVDGLPTVEPRVLHGLAHAAGIDVPTPATFARWAEAWRPFRMWVCVLLSRHLARSGGWNAPGLAEERAAAGKSLARRTATRPGRSG